MKDQIINIRVDSELKDQIKHRASSVNRNVSEYLLDLYRYDEGLVDLAWAKPIEFEPMKKIEPIDIKYSKVDLVDLKEKHDISYSSLEIEAVNTLADIRSIIDSDMED